MPKTHARHNESHIQVGSIVEFLGKDRKNRGIGIVIEDMSIHYDKTVSKHVDSKLAHCIVFWQVSQIEEYIHKAFLRRIPDKVVVTKYKKIPNVEEG